MYVYVCVLAPLPPPAQRHQWRPCDPDGLHRVHRCCSYDGRPSPAGTAFFKSQTPPHACSAAFNLQPCFIWMFSLQDHDVQEDKILLVSLLMAEMGVHSVAYAFPQVKIITTAVDKKVNDVFHIIPGIGEWYVWDAVSSVLLLNLLYIFARFNNIFCNSAGNFGDRYFGTDAPPDWSEDDLDEPSYWLFLLFLMILDLPLRWEIRGYIFASVWLPGGSHKENRLDLKNQLKII